MRFGSVVGEGGACWFAQAPHPGLRHRVRSSRHDSSPRAASGRLWRQALSSSLPALPRSCLACAAWSFLRERLTPRPPAAVGNYRFGFRQNKLVNLFGWEGMSKQGSVNGSTLLNRDAASVAVGVGRSRLGKPSSGVIPPRVAALKSDRASSAQSPAIPRPRRWRVGIG